MTKLNRKQRREEAKKNGGAFKPQYNGNGPITLEEYQSNNKDRVEMEEAK